MTARAVKPAKDGSEVAEARLSAETARLLDSYLEERGKARNLSSYTLRNYRTRPGPLPVRSRGLGG